MVDKARIIAAYQSGLSILDVAVLVGAGEKTVRKVLLEAGVMRPSSGHNRHNQTREQVARLMLEA